jgi:hypothetical protein
MVDCTSLIDEFDFFDLDMLPDYGTPHLVPDLDDEDEDDCQAEQPLNFD